MVHLFYDKTEDGKYLVSGIHYVTPSDEKLASGKFIVVDTLDKPAEKSGEKAVLYCNPTSKTVHYEYVNLYKDTEEIESLKQQNTQLMLAIAEMAETNELERTETQLAIAELAEVIANG